MGRVIEALIFVLAVIVGVFIIVGVMAGCYILVKGCLVYRPLMLVTLVAIVCGVTVSLYNDWY